MEDDVGLKRLGYDQVLHRGLNAFSNFAFGFTEVAVLASFTSQYGYGLATGGKFIRLFAALLAACDYYEDLLLLC